MPCGRGRKLLSLRPPSRSEIRKRAEDKIVGAEIASKAKHYGVRSVLAVVIDGKLASCCTGRGPDEDVLRAALAQSRRRSRFGTGCFWLRGRALEPGTHSRENGLEKLFGTGRTGDAQDQWPHAWLSS